MFGRIVSRATAFAWLPVVLLLPACGARQAAPTPPATAASASPASAAAPSMVPPDGKWLVDGEGRQYFVMKVPKYEGNYFWLEPETRVQLRYGAIYDVVSHDAESFSVKIYKVDAPPPPPAKAPPKKSPAKKPAESGHSFAKPVKRIALRSFERGLPTEGQWRNGFELADMNGDGHLDIVHGPPRKGQKRPMIFLGDGQGGWTRWGAARFPSLAYDYGNVAVADFDRDGHPDIALAMHLRGLAVLVGDGAGGFKSWSTGLPFALPGDSSQGNIFTSRAVVAADWNSDGWTDLVALGEGPRFAVSPGGQDAKADVARSYGMAVFVNHGDGTWAVRDEAGVPRAGGHFGDGLAVGDLNGDGKPDAALASSVLGEKLILRLGDGAGWAAAPVLALPGTVLVNAVELVDFDRDGRLDIAVGYQTHEEGTWRCGVDLYYNRGEAEWERRPLWEESGRAGFFALSSGDLDGDGRSDLVALSGDGRMEVFLGDAQGFLEQESGLGPPPRPDRCRGYAARLGDLDGDGRQDVVAAFAGESSLLNDPERCRNEGALRAWRSEPAR